MKKLTLQKNGSRLEIPCYVKVKSLRLRNGSWMARKAIFGKDTWITALPEHSKQEAWEAINQEVHSRLHGDDQVRVLGQRSTWPLLVDLAAKYLTAGDAQVGGASLKTRELNVYCLKKVLAHLGDFNKLRVDKFDKQAIWKFQSDAVDHMKPGRLKNVAAGGANSVLKKARAIFGKRVRADFWGEVGVELPANILVLNEVRLLPSGSTKYVPPTADEEAQFFADIKDMKTQLPDSYAAFLMAYGAGFRADECRHAKWSWLKEFNGGWMLHIQFDDEFSPKGNKERVVPISDEIAQELIDTKTIRRNKHNYQPMEAEFILQRGRKYQAFKKVSAWFKTRGWKENRVLHQFRKHFGSQVVTQTGSLYDAQTLLGHATYQTTEAYYTAPLDVPNAKVSLPALAK